MVSRSMRQQTATQAGSNKTFTGHIMLDLEKANDAPDIPLFISPSHDDYLDGNIRPDHDSKATAHALLMILAFLIMMPSGILILHLFDSVRWHWVNQALATFVALVGGGVGISLSMGYNQSKHYNTSHQIIGIALLVLLIGQAFIGYLRHSIFMRTGNSPSFYMVHRYLGAVLIIVGIVNGGLGLRLTFNNRYYTLYATVSVSVLIIGIALLYLKKRHNIKTQYMGNPRVQNFRNERSVHPHHEEIHLNNAGESQAWPGRQNEPVYGYRAEISAGPVAK